MITLTTKKLRIDMYIRTSARKAATSDILIGCTTGPI